MSAAETSFRREHIPEQPPDPARDPVCGMIVSGVDASLHVETPAGRIYFCGTGCRAAYLDNPAAYTS